MNKLNKKNLLFLLIFLLLNFNLFAENLDSLYKQGLQEEKNKNYLTAVKFYTQISTKLNTNTNENETNADFKFNTLYHLGNCYSYLGKYRNALENYKKALKIHSDNTKIITLIGVSYNKIQKYDDAINILTKGLQLEPNNWHILLLRGGNYIQIEDYEQALNDLLTAKNIAPNNDTIYSTLISIYANTISPYYNINKALEYAKKAVEITPSFTTRIAYAQILLRTSKAKKALDEIKLIENEIKNKNGYEYEHLILGIIYNRMRLFEKSIFHLNKALPNYANRIKNHVEFRDIKFLKEFTKLEKKINDILK
jgi:tetratricopeptide (TPR) repeat protein